MIDEQAQVCAFCKSDPEALADAHEEGWRAGREHEQRETERIVAERLAAVRAELDNAEDQSDWRDEFGDYWVEVAVIRAALAPRTRPDKTRQSAVEAPSGDEQPEEAPGAVRGAGSASGAREGVSGLTIALAWYIECQRCANYEAVFEEDRDADAARAVLLEDGWADEMCPACNGGA